MTDASRKSPHEGIAPQEAISAAAAAATATSALDVSSLLAGSRLLVLGGTGFVGKVFWAMLLDRYPGVGKIYLLVRSTNGRTSEERFWSQIAKSEPFDPLRKTHGAGFDDFLREKIVVIDGDVGERLCGLGDARVQELTGAVDAIVNVAGVVDFNPPLDEALDANARGTMHVVELAKALGNVPLLHTSTCYTAGRRQGPILETDPLEIPFPRAGELSRDSWDADRELAECAEIVREVQRRAEDAFRQSEFEEAAKKQLRARGEPTRGEALDRERAKIQRRFVSEQLTEAGIERANHWGWPNIYTYTKSLGEQMIARSGVPYALVRPACCESTVEFPFVGWNEGISTSAPIIYLIMKGQVQLPLGDVPLDLIPTDYVCAGMILALAELLEGTAKPVYQLGGSDVNACSVARFGELTGLYKRKYYQRKGTGNPFTDFLQAHMEPVAISEQRFDAWSSPAMGKIGREVARAMRKATPALKPAADAIEGAAKREEKIANILKLFAPFTANQNGPFSCANVRAAQARLGEADRAKLPWAPESIHWPTWFHTVHMPAMEKWILPEMDKKLAGGKRDKTLAAHDTLIALLEEMAERHAHAPALTRLEKGEASRVTYLELRARSRAVAARLAAAGVAKGDRVILSAKNHPDWAIAYFGILRAGAVAVPIDPALDDAARTNLIVDCAAAAVVSDDVRIAHPNAFAIHALTLADDALTPPTIEVSGDDVASLLYTSGTTGKPKGVRLTHANFAALVASLAPLFPLSGKDRTLSVLPLHHTFEFTCGLLLPLSRGAHVMYLDELSGHRLAEGLSAGKITAMVGVPALWQLLERRIVSEIEARGAVATALFQAGGELNRLLGSELGIDAGRLLFRTGPRRARGGASLAHLRRRRASERDPRALRQDGPAARRGVRPHGSGSRPHRRESVGARQGGERRKSDPRRRGQDREPGRGRGRRGHRARAERDGRIHRRSGNGARDRRAGLAAHGRPGEARQARPARPRLPNQRRRRRTDGGERLPRRRRAAGRLGCRGRGARDRRGENGHGREGRVPRGPGERRDRERADVRFDGGALRSRRAREPERTGAVRVASGVRQASGRTTAVDRASLRSAASTNCDAQSEAGRRAGDPDAQDGGDRANPRRRRHERSADRDQRDHRRVGARERDDPPRRSGVRLDPDGGAARGARGAWPLVRPHFAPGVPHRGRGRGARRPRAGAHRRPRSSPSGRARTDRTRRAGRPRPPTGGARGG